MLWSVSLMKESILWNTTTYLVSSLPKYLFNFTTNSKDRVNRLTRILTNTIANSRYAGVSSCDLTYSDS